MIKITAKSTGYTSGPNGYGDALLDTGRRQFQSKLLGAGGCRLVAGKESTGQRAGAGF